MYTGSFGTKKISGRSVPVGRYVCFFSREKIPGSPDKMLRIKEHHRFFPVSERRNIHPDVSRDRNMVN